MEQETTHYPPGDEPGTRSEGPTTKEAARDTAAAVAGAVKEEYNDLRAEASQQAREVVDSVSEQALSYAERKREAVGANIEAIATALEAGVQSLEEQGNNTAAAYGRQAAAGVVDLAEWVQGKSLAELWQHAETYARRQPAVTFGGAMAAGFLLARFLKSSAPPQPGGYGPDPQFAVQRETAPASTEQTTG